MDREFQFAALSPPGQVDPAIPIAAARAGALGVLDLEFSRDLAAGRAALRRLVHFAHQSCAIKLDPASTMVELLDGDLGGIETVLLTFAAEDLLQTTIDSLRSRGIQVLLEVTDLEQARVGERIGVDGLIAKGHECSGRIGAETTFILLQRLLRTTSLPVWAQGGIGLHTAAACYAAGAAGVMLGSQLALTRESQLPPETRAVIAQFDGSQTILIGEELGDPHRVYARPRLPVVERLQELARSQSIESSAWRDELSSVAGAGRPEEHLWILGQDAAFAASLAKQFQTVGGVIAGIREAIADHVRLARELEPLGENSPLARSLGTRYPIAQGPMTRVSDRAAFAGSVAEGGGLPFLALALMRAPDLRELLRETKQLLPDTPWGVGILGFVPLELRQEQLEVIREHRPPFALIAGGRPDQALVLEKEGIPTFLHVPSPSLLKLFLDAGSRRFVFEGRECGGHVGPRTSFVLWEQMIDVLLDSTSDEDLADCHILFAGGIHDALSASMISAMAAKLAERGAKVGVLMGTAYILTAEAVSSGAIVEGFQKVALGCTGTALLETGPGHATRCAVTDFSIKFSEEKRRLESQGLSHEEVRNALEELNLGRLRIATKGVTRNADAGRTPDAPKLVDVDADGQQSQGMYMIGQVAALREQVCTIAELHHDVCIESTHRLARLDDATTMTPIECQAKPLEIAIVGMSCVLPGAENIDGYWDNILAKVFAITEVPKSRWDTDIYFDEDRNAPDKIYSKWGGFIDPVRFDPLEFGMPPNTLPSIDSMQLLALSAARDALGDAGYLERSFNRDATSVILGCSGGLGDLGASYAVRTGLPAIMGEAADEVIAGAGDKLPEWTEDSFAGLLPNVTAGRIANRLDLGGLNFVVDAACASSLAALNMAVRELESETSDMVIVGGVDTIQNPFGYMCFAKTQALSPTGTPRTFDENADGIVIGEGVVMLVLKRLADAERDGDRIYSVIRGTAGSSDGKAMGMTAPRIDGQQRALERAYAKAGISPTTVELFEAHGTGTAVGDRTEAVSLAQYLERSGAAPHSAAIGSVKTMIGHTKATAGVASIAKAALALHHKVLPATLGVTTPNSQARLLDGPIYVNAETRPWIRRPGDSPRRAGVSSFGFGGTNFHAILEEYTGDFLEDSGAVSQRWPSELLVWNAADRAELRQQLETLAAALDEGALPRLPDLAAMLARTDGGAGQARLAIITTSREDLREKLARALEQLTKTDIEQFQDPRGIYFSSVAVDENARLAFLFPGQGSQHPNMLRDLAIYFPEVRSAYERADEVLDDRFPDRLSTRIFPPPRFNKKDEQADRESLAQTNVAQPALGAASVGMLDLLKSLGLKPAMTAGHSYGEYVSLFAAGAMDEPTLHRLSETRGRVIVESAKDDLGTMAAVSAASSDVADVIDGLDDVWIANRNAPAQTIISGTRSAIDQAIKRFEDRKIRTTQFAVSCGFHSPLVAPAQQAFVKQLEQFELQPPQIDVYSNTTGERYPTAAEAIRERLGEHLVRPVEFIDEIEAMYAAGARCFVEVGPGNVLTNLVGRILGDRPHTAVTADSTSRHGVTQLQHSLAQLIAAGVPVNCGRLTRGRMRRELSLARLVAETKPAPPSATTWLVDGARARPINSARVKTKPKSAKNGSDKKPPPASPAASAPVSSTPVQPPATSSAEKTPSPPAVPAAASRETPPAISTGTMTDNSPPADPSAIPQSAPPTAANDATAVMIQYQQLMGQFLQAQQQVMLGFLGGSTDGVAVPQLPPTTSQPAVQPQAPAPVTAPSTQPIGEPAAAVPPPVSQPAKPATPTAEPGDSAGAGQAQAATATSPTAAVTIVDADRLTAQLLDLVSDRTGYPVEMLDVDLDIEAELGIDSIKRVEILAMLQSNCMPEGFEAGESDMEELLKFKTMRGIVDWMVSNSQPASAASPDAPQHSQPALQTETPATQATAPAPSAAESTPTPATIDRGQLTAQLLDLVSDRTGYPVEMLDVDLDIEAELGIDSIKRVEILAMLQSNCMPEGFEAGETDMEELLKFKTMRSIVDWMADSTGPRRNGAADHDSQPADAAGETPAADTSTTVSPAPKPEPAKGPVHVPRFLFQMVDKPVGSAALPQDLSGVVLITDDEQGVANATAEALKQHGLTAIRVRRGDEVREVEPGLYSANLTARDSVDQLVQTLSEQGPITGLVHLVPLQHADAGNMLELSAFEQRTRDELTSLFHLTQACSESLQSAAENGTAWVIAATAMGGSLGADLDDHAALCPVHGGIAGFLKTLALEWPQVHCKLVDLDEPTASNPDKVATLMAAEMAQPKCRQEVEVGYREDRRQVPQPICARVRKQSEETLDLDSDSVLLITGGARGITSTIACDFARRYQPKIILIGRSPMPEGEESADTASLTTQQDIKRVLIERHRTNGKPPTPGAIEVAYSQLMKQREMRDNVAQMRESGSEVHYYQGDVGDESALSGLLDSIYETFGHIDGVIHGAGIIEDKLLAEKTLDSFDRVYQTKTHSAHVLGRLLRPESLKFLVFFSSMAGRFGNRGQCDYAAANEVLNKLAISLDAKWPARVVAANWGPWLTGMVSPEIQKQFEQRGVQLIPPAAGAQVLHDELCCGSKGEVEIVYGGGPWEQFAVTAPAAPTTSNLILPLLNQPPRMTNGGAIETFRTLDPEEDTYLLDHVLDDKPVFPLAMAMELSAEVVQHGWPEMKFVGIRSMNLMHGIVLTDGPKEVRVVAKPATDASFESLDLEVNVEITEVDRPDRLSYRCTVLMSDRFPEPIPFDPSTLAPLDPLPLSVDECYEQWLFHGPFFQGISRLYGVNDMNVVAEVVLSSPDDGLASRPGGDWLLDPATLDCGFQLGILWERVHYDMTPLPARIDGYHRYGEFTSESVKVYFVARSSVNGRILNGDLYFVGPDDRLVSVIENMQTACSKELNRLAGHPAGAATS